LIKSGVWNRNAPRLDGIVGQYRRNDGQPGYPWLDYHPFVNANSNDLLMRANPANGPDTTSLQMLIETFDDRLHVVISGATGEPPHFFDIGFPLAADEGRVGGSPAWKKMAN
jgi:hypothetical protein